MTRHSDQRKSPVKRVALLCTALNEVGGTSRHMVQICQAMDRKKFVPLIVFSSTDRPRLEAFFKDHGCPGDDLYFVPVVSRDPWGCCYALYKLWGRLKPDIVHSFFLHSDILSWITTLFFRNIVRISSVEGKFIWDNVNGVGAFKNVCYRLLNRIMRSFFARTIAVSSDLKREVVASGTRPEFVQVIGIGVPVPQGPFLRVPPDGRQTVGLLGRFSFDKGVDLFIEAAAQVSLRFPEVRFIVAGAGQELDRLRQLGRDLGIEAQLSFPGWVKDAASFFHEVDVFVMPSRREGCPLALLEAMMQGKACVVFNAPGINEIASHEMNALVVPCFDVKAMADAIVRLLEDTAFSADLGSRARDVAMEKYTVERELMLMEDVYLNCCPESSGHGE
ncbi:MAG: glycosyltransferase [Candidatus Omnitrophota bacterium]